ncbi:hypothetical protein MBAV_004636, partial [Candidatus Magnetobacterium bavaricum]
SHRVDGCSGLCGDIKYEQGGTAVSISGVACSKAVVKYETIYDFWKVTSNVENEYVICIFENEVSTIRALRCVKGLGLKSADDINNSLIAAEAQARVVGETFLNDNYYKKIKAKIRTFYQGVRDGQIATIINGNDIFTGIIRSAGLTFSLKNNVLVIEEDIEIYAYQEVAGVL